MKKIYTIITFLLVTGTCLAQDAPIQATSGPGGTEYNHAAVKMFDYGAEPEGFLLFEPAEPSPESANVVIFNHGLGQTNPALYGAWIKHLVRKGNIVIYPRYEIYGDTPKADFVPNAATGILAALDTLKNTGHVKANEGDIVMTGHSFGGLVTANLLVQAEELGIPQVRGAMICQTYNEEELVLPSYAGIPEDTKLLIVVGADDFIAKPEVSQLVFETENVHPEYKNYISHLADDHGDPALTAQHDDPLARDDEFDNGASNLFVNSGKIFAKTDAIDYYCYWKLLDALLDCSINGTNCEYAFNDAPEQRHMGTWSDGQAVVELEVQVLQYVGVEESIIPSLKMTVQVVDKTIQVQSSYIETADYELQLLNINGQTIQTAYFPSQTANQSMTMDIASDLPKGMYLMKVRASNGQWSARRAVMLGL